MWLKKIKYGCKRTVVITSLINPKNTKHRSPKLFTNLMAYKSVLLSKMIFFFKIAFSFIVVLLINLQFLEEYLQNFNEKIRLKHIKFKQKIAYNYTGSKLTWLPGYCTHYRKKKGINTSIKDIFLLAILHKHRMVQEPLHVSTKTGGIISVNTLRKVLGQYHQ